jgi:hypothetical protein
VTHFESDRFPPPEAGFGAFGAQVSRRVFEIRFQNLGFYFLATLVLAAENSGKDGFSFPDNRLDRFFKPLKMT